MSGYNQGFYTYKVVLLGETAVGKTSLATQFVNKTYSRFQDSTIGAAFLSKQVEVDGRQIRFEIWDTAGQERYRSLAPMYYRNAKVALVVFDITNRASFEGAKSWVFELMNNLGGSSKIIMLGNKVDLEDKRQVKKEDIDLYIYQNGFEYYETTATNFENVETMFKKVAGNLDLEDGIYKSSNLDIQTQPVKVKKCWPFF